MHFLSEELDTYVTLHSQDEPELLMQLNKETHQKILQPRMLSGHFQGRVLSMLSKIIHPTNILEVGTYTGYATLCLAEGLAENGTIDTLDIEEELVDFQRKYFDKSPWGSQITQHLGEATTIIPTINIKFDLVFIDGDHSYEGAKKDWEHALKISHKETVIVIDNVWDIRLKEVRRFYDDLKTIKWDFEEWNDEYKSKNMVQDTAITLTY